MFVCEDMSRQTPKIEKYFLFVCERLEDARRKKLTFKGQFVCYDLADAYISIGVMIVSRPILSTA